MLVCKWDASRQSAEKVVKEEWVVQPTCIMCKCEYTYIYIYTHIYMYI